MRSLLSAVLLLNLGCGPGVVPAFEGGAPLCPGQAPSAWERLSAEPIGFQLHPETSVGAFTTRRVRFVGDPTPVTLRVNSGQVELFADQVGGTPLLLLSRFEGALADVRLTEVHLPPSGLTLANVFFRLSRAVALPVRWLGGGTVGEAAGTVPLEIHLALRSAAGAIHPLEVAHLDGLPVELLVQRGADGTLLMTATVAQPGPLWDFGGLFEFGNLSVTLDGSEDGALIELPFPAGGAAL